ncbi:MAG: hypothetical protein LOD85_06195, partial [Clostridia bacterium]
EWANLKEVGTCYDCELDSCYPFEAYAARRRLMRERTRSLLAKLSRLAPAKATGAGCGGGCGGCAAGGGAGGCAGCSAAGGCSAVRLLEALEQLEAVQ